MSTEAKFLTGLARAFDPGPASDEPQEMRQRYIKALRALLEYLETLGANRRWINSFAEFASALWDLNDGTVRPMLAPSNRTHRPPDSSEIWRKRCFAAVAVEMLCRGGATKKAASAEVAKKFGREFVVCATFKKTAVSTPRPKALSNVIESWHDKLSADTVKNHQARAIYRASIENLDRMPATLSLDEVRELAWKYLEDRLSGGWNLEDRKYLEDRFSRG